MFFSLDSVQTKRHNHKGIIIKKDNKFSGNNDWLKQQEIPLHPSILNQSWYEILCEKEGSVYTNETDLFLIQKLDMSENINVHFYVRSKTDKLGVT